MKRHGFLVALLLVVVSCGSPSETANVASKGGPKKDRRILYYDSAAVQSHSYLDRGKVEPYMSLIYDIKTHDDFLDASVRMVKGTQVDTYLWHIGNGAEPPWNIPTDLLWDCFDSYEQVNDIVIRACHEQGLEVWGSLRMSDLHAAFRSRSLEELDDVFKTQHPEYLMAPMTDRRLPSELTEQRLWVSLDYTHPEVRQHRLDYIAKTAARHDFDGYELDFNRMGIHFPMGQGRQKAHLMTDLMRQIRERLNAIGDERGRPYTLAVHVMDSLETNLEIGLDVEAWARDGLVDVLLVGLGYMPDQLAIGQWVGLAGETGVQVYPSINPNTMRAGAWETLRGEPLFRQGMRAYADYYLDQGADGIYLFNFRHEPTQPLTEEEFEGVLSELGERETMAGKDKVYAINPTAHSGGPFYHGSEPALLPIVLDRVERKLRFHLGPAAEDSQASLRLSVFTAKAGKGTTLWARLNHTLLPEPEREGDWFHYEVPAGVARSGMNEVGLISDVPAAGPFAGLIGPPNADPAEFLKQAFGRVKNVIQRDQDPVVVHQVFLEIGYLKVQ